MVSSMNRNSQVKDSHTLVVSKRPMVTVRPVAKRHVSEQTYSSILEGLNTQSSKPRSAPTTPCKGHKCRLATVRHSIIKTEHLPKFVKRCASNLLRHSGDRCHIHGNAEDNVHYLEKENSIDIDEDQYSNNKTETGETQDESTETNDERYQSDSSEHYQLQHEAHAKEDDESTLHVASNVLDDQKSWLSATESIAGTTDKDSANTSDIKSEHYQLQNKARGEEDIEPAVYMTSNVLDEQKSLPPTAENLTDTTIKDSKHTSDTKSEHPVQVQVEECLPSTTESNEKQETSLDASKESDISLGVNATHFFILCSAIAMLAQDNYMGKCFALLPLGTLSLSYSSFARFGLRSIK